MANNQYKILDKEQETYSVLPAPISRATNRLKDGQEHYYAAYNVSKKIDECLDFESTEAKANVNIVSIQNIKEDLKHIIDGIKVAGNSLSLILVNSGATERLHLNINIFGSTDELEWFYGDNSGKSMQDIELPFGALFANNGAKMKALADQMKSKNPAEKAKALEELKKLYKQSLLYYYKDSWNKNGAGKFSNVEDIDGWNLFLNDLSEQAGENANEYLHDIDELIAETGFNINDFSNELLDSFRAENPEYLREKEANEASERLARWQGLTKFGENIADGFTTLASLYAQGQLLANSTPWNYQEMVDTSIDLKESAGEWIQRDLTNEQFANLVLEDDYWRLMSVGAHTDIGFGGEIYNKNVLVTEQTTNSVVMSGISLIPGVGQLAAASLSGLRRSGQTMENALQAGLGYDKSAGAASLNLLYGAGSYVLDRAAGNLGVLGSATANGIESGADVLLTALTNSMLNGTKLTTEINNVGGWENVALQAGVGVGTTVVLSAATSAMAGNEMDWFGNIRRKQEQAQRELEETVSNIKQKMQQLENSSTEFGETGSNPSSSGTNIQPLTKPRKVNVDGTTYIEYDGKLFSLQTRGNKHFYGCTMLQADDFDYAYNRAYRLAASELGELEAKYPEELKGLTQRFKETESSGSIYVGGTRDAFTAARASAGIGPNQKSNGVYIRNGNVALSLQGINGEKLSIDALTDNVLHEKLKGHAMGIAYGDYFNTDTQQYTHSNAFNEGSTEYEATNGGRRTVYGYGVPLSNTVKNIDEFGSLVGVDDLIARNYYGKDHNLAMRVINEAAEKYGLGSDYAGKIFSQMDKQNYAAADALITGLKNKVNP